MNENNMRKDDWSFEDFVGEDNSFQNHIEDSLVFYPMIQDLIVALARYYVAEGTKVIDVGCSTNALVHRLKDKIGRNCSYIGIDNVNLSKEDDPFLLIGDARYDCNYNNSSLVTSCFTFEFLSKQDRLPLMQKIYDGLIENGAFVLVGKTINEDSYMQNAYDGVFLSKKHGNFNWEEIMQKHERLRGIQVPLTNSENVQMMKKVGFSNVSMFFRYLNFVGLIGVK